MLRPYSGETRVRSRWALADGGAQIAAVAHEEERGDGFQGTEQPEHTALAFADGEGKGLEERAFEGDPIGGRVHFVFGEFEFAVTDIFVGKEFYFFEADDLRAD